jgi:hypothetical protein
MDFKGETMPQATVTISQEFWQRIIDANPDIPLDPDTQEPTMTEVQMARKQIYSVVKRYVMKDETRKARRLAKTEALPVTEDDFIFE